MTDHAALAQRLTQAAEYLADDLPEGTVAPQFLEGDVPLDQLDQYCVDIMQEAATALAGVSEQKACHGCGSTKSMVELRAGRHIACCPERRMLTASEWRDLCTKAEDRARALQEILTKVRKGLDLVNPDKPIQYGMSIQTMRDAIDAVLTPTKPAQEPAHV